MEKHHTAKVLKRGGFMAVKYDPTVNLGHVLTFIGFMAAGSAAYFDARTDIRLEQQQNVDQALQIKQLREDMIGANATLKAEMNAWFIRFDDKLERIREEKRQK